MIKKELIIGTLLMLPALFYAVFALMNYRPGIPESFLLNLGLLAVPLILSFVFGIYYFCVSFIEPEIVEAK